MIFDRFQGDPAIMVTQAGAEMSVQGGQPVMDQGVQNPAFIGLFTGKGWCGNIYLPESQQIGSDFEAQSEKPITRQSLIDIKNAAERALAGDLFGDVVATVTNPVADALNVSIYSPMAGAVVASVKRSKGAWQA